jgi:hypothetical protein
MKILVATTKTQGTRKNDFCHVPEAEPVMFGFECDGEAIDGGCGCRRSMVGIGCRQGTTTVLVSECAGDKAWLAEAFGRSLRQAGFKPEPQEVTQTVEAVLDVAAHFATGTVLERRGNAFRVRAAGKE